MFSQKLKQLRKDKGITQQVLADALNLSRSTIAGYEIEDKQPSYEVIAKIARYFSISTDYLLDAGLFEPKTYDLISMYRLPIISKLYKDGYITANIRKKICECPIYMCVEFLSTYICDVNGTHDSITYNIKPHIGVLGDKLFCSLSKSQIDELPYNRFDEVPRNHIQKDIIDDIMNLPPDEQEQLRNYIAIRSQLSSSVAAHEPERKVSGK